jgi:hypothetical protein
MIVLQWPMILTNAEKPVLCSSMISLNDQLYASVTRQVPLDHVQRSSATWTGYEEEQGQPIRQKVDKFLSWSEGTMDRTLPRLSTFVCCILEIINGSHWPFRKHMMLSAQRLCPYITTREPDIWFSWDLTSYSATNMCLHSIILVKMWRK